MNGFSPIFGRPIAQPGILGLQPRQAQGVGDLLTSLGIGLMGNGPSRTPVSPLQGLGQGFAMNNQLAQQRQQEQLAQSQSDMAQAEFGMKQQEFQQQQEQDQAQRDALEKAISGLPIEQQSAARADPASFWRAYNDHLFATTQEQAPTSVQEFEYAKNNGFVGSYFDFIKQKAAAGQQDASLRYGLNPVYGTDESGRTVMMLPNNQGGVKVVTPPDGVNISPQTQYLDVGTGYIPKDKRNPNADVGPTVTKNVAEEKSLQSQGEQQGKVAFSLPDAIATADQALATLHDLKTDPARKWATGATSMLASRIPGTAGYDYTQKVNQAKGQVFKQVYESLRGAGAITEIESSKAEQAIARLDTAQSEDGFLQALNDLEVIIKSGRARAQAKASAGPQIIDQSGGSSVGGADPLGLFGGGQ